MAIMPFLTISCKKELPVAIFKYERHNHYVAITSVGVGSTHTSYQVDYVTIETINTSYNASSFLWQLSFPNGTILTSTEFIPSFVCDISGHYELKLTAYNNDGEEDSYIATFYISIEYDGGGGNPDNPDNPADPDDPITPPTPPTASFNINSSNGTFAPSTIYCHNNSVNATHYQWTLTRPDNTSATSTSMNPSFNCNLSGTYTIRLIAYSSDNQSSTSSMSFSLTIPSKFTITWLRLEDIPMTDTDNSSWDTGLLSGADPDIFFKIINSSSSVLYTSGTKNDIGESDLPVTWYNVNKTLNYTGNYYIRFYDYDDGLDDHDIMVSCNLTTSNMTPGTSSVTWSNPTAGVRFVIGLTWSE